MTKYKVTNKSKTDRKFFDRYSGRWIIVRPRENVTTAIPPSDLSFFNVSVIDENEEKEKKLKSVRKLTKKEV